MNDATDIRRVNMRKGSSVCGGLIMLAAVLATHAAADTLGDKIGVVATNLFSGTVTNGTGSSVAATQARDWDQLLLAEGSRPTNAVTPTFRDKAQGTYDAVRMAFSVSGQQIETRQTISVWTLTLADQDTTEKSNVGLAALVSSVASNRLDAFTYRSFAFEGTYDNVKVFSLVIEAGHESGDWRDTVWAIVDGTKICFSCTKKENEPSAGVVSSDPEANQSWFSVVEWGSKEKAP